MPTWVDICRGRSVGECLLWHADCPKPPPCFRPAQTIGGTSASLAGGAEADRRLSTHSTHQLSTAVDPGPPRGRRVGDPESGRSLARVEGGPAPIPGVPYEGSVSRNRTFERSIGRRLSAPELGGKPTSSGGAAIPELQTISCPSWARSRPRRVGACSRGSSATCHVVPRYRNSNSSHQSLSMSSGNTGSMSLRSLLSMGSAIA